MDGYGHVFQKESNRTTKETKGIRGKGEKTPMQIRQATIWHSAMHVQSISIEGLLNSEKQTNKQTK